MNYAISTSALSFLYISFFLSFFLLRFNLSSESSVPSSYLPSPTRAWIPLSLYKSSPNLHNPAVLFRPLPTAIPVQAQFIVAMLRKPCSKGREFLTCG
ncbi:hypothetical protein DER46DRAFT_610649 [Fusarium sp. MPI-SDFR-AT-0072]|nr:hypothetical protein DER46DRAFT_610649 [Fusarium sp. MPI-SDFR-AT-0072]